jgi:hypothetical protein
MLSDTKEHGFIFKAEMIRAILAGLKSQTRRVVTAHNSLIDGTGKGIRDHWKHLDWSKARPGSGPDPCWHVPCLREDHDAAVHQIYPRVQVGDRIYAKETWRAVMEAYRSYVEYKADGGNMKVLDRDMLAGLKKISLRFPGARKDRHSNAWRSPLHMPRWAARIVRPVTGVKAERVNEIPFHTIRAEGVRCPEHDFPGGFCASECEHLRSAFYDLWNSINGKKPGRHYLDRPPVWAYEWESMGKA